MTYYDLSETERKKLYRLIEKEIIQDLLAERKTVIEKYFSDPDTYIRKNCYLILGRIYKAKDSYRPKVLQVLDVLANSGNEKIRQTVVYTLGEIGKYDFDTVRNRIDFFINDIHHSVKNSLTGAIKQMGEKNPDPFFLWAKDKLKRSNADMVKRILHGLELRGRSHPEELLPILKDIFNRKIDDKKNKMIIHIIGQISYKKGCIEKVVSEIKTWDDKEFISESVTEIIKVHKKYASFSAKTPKEAEEYLLNYLQ